MSKKTLPQISISGAKTNNLKNLSLAIPHHKLIAVTGISGSGKSSLIFEILAKEGQRRYFETLPSFARQYLGKLNRPEVDQIEGLSPVIAIGQHRSSMNARSTVGTMSDIYDMLRLLFARVGVSSKDIKLSRSLFSFNSPIGKCERCNGIGQEEQIDLDRLVTHPDKTIREGALAPTLPTGYIMYSQVTIDVLNEVCQAEGFDVDIPWNKLTDTQKEVILYGSQKIKVPFGKHSLESRLKWTGIKAKPREEGHYKGMITIMSDILKRDRNANILKYVKSVTCPACLGARLNADALSVSVKKSTIIELAQLEVSELKLWLTNQQWDDVGATISSTMLSKLDTITDLGLGHLTLDRPSNTLKASEIQRLRMANQVNLPLSNILYIFDEPSIGLHPDENERLIHHFRKLVNRGNTVIVVEHDLATITHADHIIEVGPGAGILGGEIIYNSAVQDFLKDASLAERSPTYRALQSFILNDTPPASSLQGQSPQLSLLGCHARNLKYIDVHFQLGKLNIISGKSGSGKTSLIRLCLIQAVSHQLGNSNNEQLYIQNSNNLEAIDKLIYIDHSPIGKTPRSNPATYLGLSDHIRDIFAKTAQAKQRGYTKSRFSFNNKGGRCEDCQGAGKVQIGMHYLGNVDLLCGTCNGKRFNQETLDVKYKGKSIAEIYQLSIEEAVVFFIEDKKVLSGLTLLRDLGLGYMTLGQSSTNLSGGEAQRIKIANQLQKKDTGNTLYILNEPSIGLHRDDINSLLGLFARIKSKGNTILCIEQDDHIIANSDWHIELGPRGGKKGGHLLYQGKPQSKPKVEQIRSKKSINAEYPSELILEEVTTQGLKNINLRIPKNKITVVTGLSGSGKSSLVYDTILAESQARFTQSLTTYQRSFIQQNNPAKIGSYSGLGPAIGINRRSSSVSKRSTVGTLSGIYDDLRLLYSRMAQAEGKEVTAQHFSFNHHLGACLTCAGIGTIPKCDHDLIISDRHRSILDGAMSKNKAVAYYSNPNGQFMATLHEVAQHLVIDLNLPWKELSSEAQQVILYGTGAKSWKVTWNFTTKSRSGSQELTVPWLGFCNYIDDEYARKRQNKNIEHLKALLRDNECSTCHGGRLKTDLLTTLFLGQNIVDLCNMSITSLLDLVNTKQDYISLLEKQLVEGVMMKTKASLGTMQDLGLGYLSLSRCATTLSGGERQRITLAGQLSSHLYGVIYVLDEPTIGLDTYQVSVLVSLLQRIVRNGNTVIAVEHDPTFIKNADYIVEMGPKAGREGGTVIFQGPINLLSTNPQSVTYKMLKDNRSITPSSHQPNDIPLSIRGASANNLKNVDVDFPTGQIIAITGVSGSGKSSLIKDVIHRTWVSRRPVNCQEIIGIDQFSQVISIDQKLANHSRLMTPVSITELLDRIKPLFAQTDKAKALGLKKNDFSYLSKKGKCTQCSGLGQIKTSMDFISDLWLSCPKCQGQRYNDAILEVTYRDKTMGEVLQMTIQQAIDFFEDSAIVNKLSVLERVGVGHLLLGQAGHTLSGGESQRLKLATSILENKKGSTLYLFDEPSTGLHYFDILKLIDVFNTLVENGDSVLFIEHNEVLIRAANQVFTLGPGSGINGGRLVN